MNACTPLRVLHNGWGSPSLAPTGAPASQFAANTKSSNTYTGRTQLDRVKTSAGETGRRRREHIECTFGSDTRKNAVEDAAPTHRSSSSTAGTSGVVDHPEAGLSSRSVRGEPSSALFTVTNRRRLTRKSTIDKRLSPSSHFLSNAGDAFGFRVFGEGFGRMTRLPCSIRPVFQPSLLSTRKVERDTCYRARPTS